MEEDQKGARWPPKAQEQALLSRSLLVLEATWFTAIGRGGAIGGAVEWSAQLEVCSEQNGRGIYANEVSELQFAPSVYLLPHVVGASF